MNSKELWKQVKENSNKLKSCGVHNFGKCPEVKFGDGRRKFTCKNCGGEMNLLDIFKYINGYKAAGGNPDDVFKGFEG